MDVLEDMRVVWEEYKRLNRVHQCCIFILRVVFKVTELYAVERWVKVITEGPDTAYFPINNPLIEIEKNIEFRMEGEEYIIIAKNKNLDQNINEIRSQGY